MQTIPADNHAEEDRVVLALLLRLREHGLPAVLVEQPDRLLDVDRTFPAVTSDALFRVDQGGSESWWATDVMALAAPASHHQVLNGLHERLTPLAVQYGLVIELQGDSPAVSDLRAIQRAVAHAVQTATASGSIDVGELSIAWRQPRANEAPQTIIIALALEAPSALLADQVRATISGPLTRKATVQAARARAAGCQTAVLLDLAGHSGIAQGTHWLPQHPATIEQAVDWVLDGTTHSLDAVLLLDRTDDWHLLYGAFPTF